MMLSFISESTTTERDRNSPFIVLNFDKKYMVSLNTHAYYFNITEDNVNPKKDP